MHLIRIRVVHAVYNAGPHLIRAEHARIRVVYAVMQVHTFRTCIEFMHVILNYNVVHAFN